jgi:hypothetical protein
MRPGLVGASILSAVLLLAHIAVNRALVFLLHADNGSGLVPLIAGWFAHTISEVLSIFLLVMFSVTCTAMYVFCVATLYCTDGDSGASRRIIRELPRAPTNRLILMFNSVVPLVIFYVALSALAWLELPQLDASDKVVVLALQLLGGAAFLTGAAYVAVVSHIACVVAVLEDAVLFGAVRKSRSLLAGKFWAAAAVFVPLDGCFVAFQISFLKLVLDDALGLGRGFQGAAGSTMAVALWAVVVLTLAAQPVVYLVCKNHHNEVVDKVHLNYVGEYQLLAVEGDSAVEVELQPVNTVQIPATTQSPVQSPASSESTESTDWNFT